MQTDLRWFRSMLTVWATMFITGIPHAATGAPAVSATKSDGVPATTRVNPGGTVTYTSIITNSGDAGTTTAAGVSFTDPDVTGATMVPNSLAASPVAVDDAYATSVQANIGIDTTLGNSFSVLTNDFKGMLNGAAVTLADLTLTFTSPTTTASNGTVTMVTTGANKGCFTYQPAAGFTGTDSFTYEISNGAPGGTTVSRTGKVTLTVVGPAIWFVNANAGTNGNGTLAKPFNTLAAFQAVNNGSGSNPKVGDTIFLYESATDYTGGVTLLGPASGATPGQRIVGQDTTGSLAVLAGITLPVNSYALPATNTGSSNVVRILNSAGNGITMGRNTQVHGLTAGNSSGFAINGVPSGTGGDLKFSEVVINTNGAGLRLLNAAIGTGSAITSITSSGGTSGVLLTGVTGALPLGSGSLSGHSSGSFLLDGGSGDISYSGTISKLSGSGSAVSIANRTTTGTISLSGAISASTVQGVKLTSNALTTIAFNGGLSLSSGVNKAFEASNGGTVTATQNNSSIINTLATTSGQALDLKTTTIGAAGLTFRSISSGPGAGNGITLDTTGTTAGLTVTGQGATAGSGGTISGKTGSDGDFISGNGIYLNSTSFVSLNRMQLNDFQNSAIRGISVTKFTFTNSVISGVVGNNTAATEGAITFGTSSPTAANGLLGTGLNASLIDNINISGAVEHGLEFYGQSGSFGLTLSNCTIHDNSTVTGSDGIQIETQGSAISTIRMYNNTFTNNKSQAIQVSALGSSVMDLTVSGNGITRGSQGNEGILVQNGESAILRSTISNNSVSGFDGTSIFAGQLAGNATASANLDATITGNTIIAPTSSTNSALIVFLSSTGSLPSQARILVDNNTITQNSNSGVARGILIDTPDNRTSPAFDVTVTNNVVNVGDHATGVNGIVAQARNGTGRFDIRANQVTGTPTGIFGVKLRQNTLEGNPLSTASLARGSSASNTAETVLSANNSASTTEIIGTVTVISNGVIQTPASAVLPLMYAPLPEDASISPTVTAETVSEVSFAALAPLPESEVHADLSEMALAAMVSAARQRWDGSGLTAAQRELLGSMKFELADLSDTRLGESAGDVIRIDRNAGGNGWFIDPTPMNDAEFASGSAIHSSAAGRVDLLTTLLHEMGHALGLCDSYGQQDSGALMYGFLSKGQRRLPAKNAALGAVPHHHAASHFLTAPLNIGDLPPGKSVVITYQVTVNDPPTSGSLSSQGTVSSTTPGFTPVLTDDLPSGGDPALPGAADATVTLVKLPDISVAVAPAAVAEDGDGTLVYTFTRTGSTAAALTAGFTVSGTATAATDYTQTGAANFTGTAGTVTFAAGATTAAVTVNPTDDTTVEPDETVILTVVSATGYNALAPTSATGTISNDDTSVAVAVTPSSVVEDGTGSMSYTFTRVGVTTGVLTANFTVSGSATFTTDYTQTGAASFTAGVGTVSFAAGVTSTVVTIKPVADNSAEEDETVILTPSTGTGYNPVTTAASGTITDDDSTVKVELLAASSVLEDGAGNLVYTFTRTGPLANALTVNVAVSGTASLTGDYSHTFSSLNTTTGAATVVFAAGRATQTVTIDPTVDVTTEPDETVILTLAANGTPSATGGYTVGTPASATGTIQDDDLPVVSVAVTTATATEGGTDGLFTFTRNSSMGALTANFQLNAESTATADTDFTLSGTGVGFNPTTGAGTIVFPDGTASITLTLVATVEASVGGGQAAEAAETVRLDVVPQAALYNGTSNATVTISANGFVVTSIADAGEGTLRQAILNANAIAGPDTIRFAGAVFEDSSPDVISLTSDQLTLTSDLVIAGPGAKLLTVRNTRPASVTSRVFYLASGTSTIRGLTVSGGNLNNTSFGAGLAVGGGNLNLIECWVTDNRTAGFAAGLGVIDPAVATAFGCTFSANTSTAPDGGAAIDNLGTLTLINTAVSGNVNTAASVSNGIGGIYNRGTISIRNSTITNNSVSAGKFSGIFNESYSTLRVSNSIIAGNQSNGTIPEVGGTIISEGGNLIGNVGSVATFTATGDQTGTGTAPLDPKLGPLADNGGPTLTHALIPGSPAINGGLTAQLPLDTFDLDGDTNTTEPIPYDQRGAGFLRSIGLPDIGAVELQKSISILADAANGAEGSSITFTVSRTGAPIGDTTVDYTVEGSGTAPASSADFTATTGSVTILDGASSAVVTIAISQDSLVEADEEFTVTLSNPTNGYAITTASASSTIIDDDAATLSIAKTTDGAEGNPTPVNGVFTVTQTAASSSDTVILYTVSGTATSGSDYTARSGTVTILAGSTTAAIEIPVINDFTVEETETVIITLSSLGAHDASITLGTPASATLNITDAAPAAIAVSAGSGQSTVVGTAFTNRFVAKVTDSAGNALQGASVTFVSSGTTASGSFAATATATTDASGLATAPAFTANNVAGSYSVRASTAGVTGTADFAVTNAPGAAASFVMSGSAGVTAGQSFGFTVTAQDAYGNTATGYGGTVHFTSTAAGTTLPANSTLTNGVKNFSATMVVGGNQSITATDTVSAGITGAFATTVTPVADLAITVTDGVTTAVPGGAVTYTITVSNAGPSAVTGATVADTFPAALTAYWTAVGAGGGTVAPAGSGNINQTINLPVGGSVTFTVSATVSPSATGTLSNTATVSSSTSDPNTDNNSATDTDALTPQADLAITVTDSVTSAVPGSTVTYTIMASNSGPSNVTGATVVNTFPASLTSVTWTANGAGGGTVTASGSGNISELVNLPSGGSVTFTVSATVSANATGTLSNTATVSAPTGTTDPIPVNNSATDTDTLTPRADLSITKTNGVTTATPGGSVTYTITASNAGPSAVSGATVADTFPASFTGNWAAVGAGGGTATASGSGNINDTVNLPVGGSVTYTVTGTISAAATGSLSNTATVSAPAGTTDPTPGNNSATDTDTLTSKADLVITMTDGVTTATPGGSVTYTIVASNAGPSNVTGATVANTLPASLAGTWTAVAAGGASVPAAAGSGNINQTVDLPSGGSVTYIVSATISPSATGTLSNTATVSSSTSDPNTANNTATDTDTLTPQADLAITMTDGVISAVPGNTITYTITASNAGPSNVTGATVEDTFPASLTTTWTAVGAGGASVVASGSGNINELVNLPSGGSVTFTVVAAVSANATGTLSNTATVSAPVGTTDPTPGNNSATDSDTLTPQADLAITMVGNSGTAISGSTITYTITATNPGPSNVTGATVADTFPASLTPSWTAVGAGGGTVAASGSGNINELVNLPVGGSVTFTVVATIASNTAAGSLTNTATIASPSGVTDAVAINNTSTVTTTLTLLADLAITKTDGATTAIPGGTVTYTIVASNAGPSNVSGATVADTFPASLTGTWTAVVGGGASVPATAGSGNINEQVNLPAGGSVTYTVTATISAGVTGTLSNTATVSSAVTDPVSGNNSATDTDTLNPNADISVTVTDSPDPVDAGSNVTYTITVNNSGPSTAQSVVLSNLLPADSTFVSLSAPAGWSSTTPAVGATGTVTSSVASLPVGSAVFTLIAKVNYIANGTILTDSATVSATSTDPVSTNNMASATTTVRAIPAIALFNGASDVAPPLANAQATAVDFGSITADDTIPLTRTFTVKNTGTGTLAVASIQVPTGFSLVAPFTVQSVAPTASFSFGVRYGASSIGTASGSVVISSNADNFASFGFPITATRTNVAPVAIAGAVSTDEDVPLPIVLSGSDVDAGQILTYAITIAPAHGVLTGNTPNLTYTPNANYNGPDSFAFSANDGTATSAPAMITITVNAVNDTPTVVAAIPDVLQVTPGNVSTIVLSDYFTDVETDAASLEYRVTPEAGAFHSTSITAGVLTITSSGSGTVDLTVTAADPEDASVFDTFELRVKHIPQVVGTGVPDTVLSPAAPDQTIDLAGYFADQDNDALTYQVLTNSDPTKASYVLTGSMLTLHPESPGDTTISVRATDIDGNPVSDSFVITVEEPIPALTPTVGFIPKVNNQNGVYEISITAVNHNVFAIPGFRVRVTSPLPAGITLRNSSGPAGAHEPYLDVLTTLIPGQSIPVILEFHSPTRNFTGFDPVIVVEPLPDGITDSGTGAGQDIEVSQIRMLPGNAGLLIEFTSQPGSFYQIEYSSNLATGPWKKSLIPVQAGANRVQWIDRGPPYTDAHPSTVPSRFYRVSRID